LSIPATHFFHARDIHTLPAGMYIFSIDLYGKGKNR